MSNHPLTGYEFHDEKGFRYLVAGESNSCPNYMDVYVYDKDDNLVMKTVRAVGLLHQHRAISDPNAQLTLDSETVS